MKPYFAALLVLMWLPRLSAEEISIRQPEPPVSLSLPKGWESDNLMDQWYQGWTPDRKVWLSAITFKDMPEARLLKWLPKHLDSFGVEAVIEVGSVKSVEIEVAKRKATEFQMTAKIEGAIQSISVYVIPVAPERVFVITTGGLREDRAKHREMIAGIVNSVKVAAKEGGE